MRSVNKVIIVGNVTRDPDYREQNNQKSCTFGIATNRIQFSKTGDRRSHSEFHEVIAWGNLAEIAKNMITKGKGVYIQGYLKTRIIEDLDGFKNRKTEIVIEDLQVLDRKQSEQLSNPEPNSTDQQPESTKFYDLNDDFEI